MSSLIVDSEMRKRMHDGLLAMEFRDETGTLLGRYLPDREYLETRARELEQIPAITSEERAKAIAEYQRGDYFTTEQMIEHARNVYHIWQESRR